MTAPLPPKPAPPHRFAIEITPNGERLDYSARDMDDFAKLAVREALQRMLEQETYAYARARIRAMLKDYE
jgi:hypothetical protein